MSLKPNNLIQAAQADLRRRQRNKEIGARPYGLTNDRIEHYAFFAAHVRRAKNEHHLLTLALAHGVPKTTKKNTILIYGDQDLLQKAIDVAAAHMEETA